LKKELGANRWSSTPPNFFENDKNSVIIKNKVMNIEDVLKKLIRFKTVSSNHKENEACLRWVQAQIKRLPVLAKIIRSHSFTSLVITTQQTKAPALWLAAHIDVVPGSPEVFIPKKQGNRLYGRGAFDMKFAVSCYIKLLKELGRDLHSALAKVCPSLMDTPYASAAWHYYLKTGKKVPELGTYTSKSLGIGGSKVRAEATALGTLIITEEVVRKVYGLNGLEIKNFMHHTEAIFLEKIKVIILNLDGKKKLI